MKIFARLAFRSLHEDDKDMGKKWMQATFFWVNIWRMKQQKSCFKISQTNDNKKSIVSMISTEVDVLRFSVILTKNRHILSKSI